MSLPALCCHFQFQVSQISQSIFSSDIDFDTSTQLNLNLYISLKFSSRVTYTVERLLWRSKLSQQPIQRE